ncbi:MAG: metal ABC transporter permease, partial [Gammaproteobacteria bacterium]|nr:metal ABC transporter permease [Gammaproteobacteria bacterium]
MNEFWLWLNEFSFLHKTVATGIIISIGAAPLGAFLVYKRMSLIGDTISHGILPGVALAYILFGYSIAAMIVGGTLAGILVALIAGWLPRVS